MIAQENNQDDDDFFGDSPKHKTKKENYTLKYTQPKTDKTEEYIYQLNSIIVWTILLS